jgi:WD40 repeat protein
MMCALAALLMSRLAFAAGDPAPSLFRGHEGTVCVAFSPDGKTLLTGGDDGLLKLWDVRSGRALHTIPVGQQGIVAVGFSPDGSVFAAGGRDQATRIWDARSGVLKRTLEGHRHYVTALAFSPTSKVIATASYDRNIILWDVESGDRVKWFSGHARLVFSIAYSPDGNLVVSGGGDGVGKGGELYLWDAATGRLKWSLKGENDVQVVVVAFSPDGQSFAAAAVTGVTRIFDTATGRVLQTLDGGGGLRGLAYSPDGKTLAMSIGKEIKLWDLKSGTVTHTLSGSESAVGSLSFSHVGSRLAAGCADGTARVWVVPETRSAPAGKAGATATQ